MARGKKTGGRQPGSRNKRTADVEAFARDILEDETYRERLRLRARTGKIAPAIEALLYHYAYGKPVERVEGTIDHTVKVIAHRYGNR